METCQLCNQPHRPSGLSHSTARVLTPLFDCCCARRCGGDGPRQNTLRFVCNAAATTAYISDVEELTTCHYYVIVQTSLVCTPPTSLRSVGSTYVSDVCGGGAWPLAQLLPNDIQFSPDNNATQVFINPCFSVQSPNCANAPQPTSVCQAYFPLSSSSTNVFQLGLYDPSRTAVQYTLLSNGITQYYQDGAYWNGYPRAMNISYVCSTAATTVNPASFVVTQSPTATGLVGVYSVTINTPAVCGASFQPAPCGGAGVDLSSISGTQLSINFGGNTWYAAPCASVISSAANGCTAQACQGGTELGDYDPNQATYTLTDNGVMMQIQDGLSCDGDGPRQLTMRYICNATATKPYILQVQEYPTCHYTYEIVTSAACSFSAALTKAVGQTYASDICGGGVYNLNTVSPGADITYYDPSGPGYVFINPCGPVQNTSCGTAGGASICYAYTPLNFTNPSNDYNLAQYIPGSAPVRYTPLTNGVQQTHIDGGYCNAFVRVVSINYVCDATATTAKVTNYTTNNCVYNITVNTAAVCTTGFANQFPTCTGAGYDLSRSLAGVQMSINVGAVYTVSPCSNVSGVATLTNGCNAQVCQSGFNLSYYDSSAQWTAADNGVVQISQTGQLCGSGANRWTVLRFVCSPLTTVPFISDAGEEPSCHYYITIQTNAVCTQPANYNAIGNTYVSDQCGGGAYDLALITDNDITYPEGSPTYAYLFFSPCGSVKNASCGSIAGPLDVSLCEAYTPLNFTNPSNEYKIAQYDPIRAPVSYTVIPGGLVQYSAAGDFDGNFPRALNTTYICDASATTPFISSYSSVTVPHPVGGDQRVYQLVVHTSVVCGAPFQKQQCGYGGVDLSGLVGTTVSGSYNGATWFVAPCSAVHASQTGGCTGQVCQSGYPMSYYDPLNTQWTLSDTGLVQFNQDGVFCGTSFARATTIRYVCNAGATTPSLSYAVEDPVCHYTLVVQTALACNPTTLVAPAVPRTVGLPYVSDLCGGGAYLLNTVSPNADIYYDIGDGTVLFINPCGAVRNTTCSLITSYGANATVCQAYKPLDPTNAFSLASWNPPNAAVQYTLLANGILQTHTDGQSFCGGTVRTVNIAYTCNATATTPVVSAWSTSGTCVHNVTVQTAAVCGSPFVPVCKANGFDLTSIGSQTISAYLNFNYWSASVCGNVSNALYPGCKGEICQGATTVSSFDPTAAVYTNADNGLTQQLQNGDSCGGDGYREGTLRFVCNAAATTPYISSAQEEPTCHYILTIQTATVCPPNLSFKTTPGLSWVSDLCGGGAYDLTQLGVNDITFPEGSPTPFAYVFFNPCGYVRNTSCGELSSTSICEAYTPLNYTNPQNSYQIAVYDPARSPVTYTVTPNGLLQQYTDGAYNNGNPRSVNITYVCDNTATTPVITQYYNNQSFYAPNNNFVTVYTVVVRTSAVCGTTFAYTQTCGTATYNLNTLAGQTITYTDPASGDQYWVNPCGLVDSPDAGGCTGQVCQSGGFTLSSYAPSLTQWLPTDNGVVAFTQDGAICNNLGFRTTYIRYICNSTATTPSIISVGEEPQCRYTIEIATSAVCGITPSHAIGSSYISDTCGGGAYDLTPLASADITAIVDTASYLFINPCGQVKNASCGNLGSSVCYAYPPLVLPPSNDYDLARFDPVHAPITYTILSNGVLQTHVDGDYCGNNVNVPRTVYISYLCNSSATVPLITNYTTNSCAYNITVATSVTCGTPFTAPTTPSSTGAASTGGVVASSGGAAASSSGVATSSGASPSTGGATPSTGAATSAVVNPSTGGAGGSSNSGGGGSSLSGGAIAGIVIGSVAAVAIALLLLWCFVCGGLARGKKAGDGFSDVDNRRREESNVELSNVQGAHEGHEGEEEATA